MKGRCKHKDTDDSNKDEYGNRLCLLVGYSCIGQEVCDDYEEEETFDPDNPDHERDIKEN